MSNQDKTPNAAPIQPLAIDIFSETPKAREDHDITIWVHMTESLTSSSFNWYRNKETASRHFENDKRVIEQLPNSLSHLFPYRVSGLLMQKQITDEIDGFLWEHGILEHFYSHESVEIFPHTAEDWKKMVSEHNNQ